MKKNLIQEFGCDHSHCLATARVKTGSMECGTNYTKECENLQKRGWMVYGLNHYCKAHKVYYN